MLNKLKLHKFPMLMLNLKALALNSSLNKRPNLYNLLQVKPSAKPEQIQFSYYRLLKKYQPDPSSDPERHAKLMNEAYVILSNQKLREKYDRENGFIKNEDQLDKKEKDEFNTFSDKINIQKQYKKARTAFADVLGDKAARQQKAILSVFTVGVFVGTLTLLFRSDPKGQKNKPRLSEKELTKEAYQKVFKGKVE